MAEVMSKQDKLKAFADAYGVAVRAGVLTPNLDDEKAIREMFGLPAPNADVIKSWADSDGVRFPITLAQGLQDEQPQGQGGFNQ